MSFDIEEIVLRYEKEIVMASFLYYNTGMILEDGRTVPESPITDEEYDARVKFVLANWGLTSMDFRKRIMKGELANSGYSLKASPKEIDDAIDWRTEKKYET